MAAILKFFKWHLLSNPKSDWAETWWEASQWHRVSELLKLFCSKIQTLSWIELKLDGKHHSDTEIQNCWNSAIPVSKMAILKFFKQHLLSNPKSDWAETWWEASQWHRFSELLKLFCSEIQTLSWIELKLVAIMKFYKLHLLPNPKSDWAETWWEASQRFKLQKSFHSNIQDSCHGGHLEILQTTSPPKTLFQLSWHLMGGITVTQRFKIAKIVPIRYPKWPPGWPSWNSSNDICS